MISEDTQETTGTPGLSCVLLDEHSQEDRQHIVLTNSGTISRHNDISTNDY